MEELKRNENGEEREGSESGNQMQDGGNQYDSNKKEI